MSTETSAENTTTVNHTTDAKPKSTLKKMKSKVRRTLNKLKPGKKNKNKNKKGETQPRDTTSHQADLADKDRVQGDDTTKKDDSTKKPVLSDASHMQRHDPLDSHSSHDDATQKVDDHHEKLGARSAKNSEPLGKHDGIDGPYSQDAHPVLESPSRQHDIPTRASDDSSITDGRKKDVLQGAPQLPDPYQKKHAVLAGIHDIPSRRDSGLASQGSSSSMTSSQAPMSSQGPISQGSISSQGPMSSEVPTSSQGPYSSQAQGPISSQAPISQDSRSTADQERIQREFEQQKLELEKEKAENLKLLQEKEVFEHAATNLLQVKGQLVGDMLQMQMDMDKIQMEKMQMETERVKREQQQIELQQERAQLQMDKDKLLKEKRILEQPGVVQKLTGKVKGVFGAPGSAEISEQAAENEEIDRTVLGLEKPVESKGMISQITDRVKSMMPSSSTGPTPAELSAYETGLVKGGLRTDDETYLQPEVEQKGMLASLTDKVKGVLPASIIGTGTSTSTVPSEQQGMLSKISQMVFGTDSSLTSASSSASTVDGVDHSLCTQGLASAQPSKIDMDIADNREAVPLAQPISQPISQADQRADIIPQADQTSSAIPQQNISKAKSVGRSPKKSPKKVGRRASKKNVYRAKPKTDIPQTE